MSTFQNPLALKQTLEIGQDSGRGNLLGIQPYMRPADYASEEAFHTRLTGYLEVARQQGWLASRTIVVLPEHIGTWLVAAGEKASIYQAPSIARSMLTAVSSHPLVFARLWLTAARRSGAQDRARTSLFLLKGARMAAIYHQVFAHLAHEFQVTLVAGSTVLPSPRLQNGELTAGDGPLYNVSLIYRPDGSPYPQMVQKAYLVKDEQSFLRAGLVSDLPVFDTPAGRLAVLICADSWHPAPYQVARAQGADLIVVPSYLTGDDQWQAPWLGYDGAASPADVDPADVGRLSEGEAWLKYGLAGRLPSAGAHWGMNVFLRGRIWDLGSDGHTILVQDKQIIEAEHVSGAAIVNYWLDSPPVTGKEPR